MNQIDSTTQSGDPVELYKFNQGAEDWLMCNAPHDVLFLTRIYIASAIKRSTIDNTEDNFKSVVTLEFALDNQFAAQFLGFTPDLSTTVDIYRVSSSDPDSDNAIIWKGRVMDANTSQGIISLECEPIHTSMQTIGLRARYERGCRHLLYSRGCGVKQEFNSTKATVIEMPSANTIVLDYTPANGTYAAGMIELSTYAMRYITAQTGNSFTVTRPFHANNLAVGDEVTVYPGCDQTKETCNSKFNNILNFGGWSYIPTNNPFQGNPF